MKKSIYLFSIYLSILFLLSSCSTDDSAPVNPISQNPTSQNLLLKKIVEGDAVLGQSTTNYTYNGNKLVEINRYGQESDIYTYTGNLITKIEKFQIYNAGTSNEETELISTDLFEYNSNDQLIEFKTTFPNSLMERATTYVYNSNTISFEQYEYYPGNVPELLKTGTITLQDGEISQLQVVKEFDSFTANYTYDNKNSLFKNVLGYDKLIFTHIIGEQGSWTLGDTVIGGISHNFVNIHLGSFEYTYNSDDYPLTASESFLSWQGGHTYQFFYY